MIKLNGGAICDHEVGADKEDFTPEKRKDIFASIKNNDWDCIHPHPRPRGVYR